MFLRLPQIRLLLLVLLCFPAKILLAQGNKLNIQATPPKNMSICGFDDTSLITVYNISSSVISGVKITLILPSGVTYLAGSVSGTGVSESNITDPNKPVFSGPSLLIAQNFRFRVKLRSDCDIISLLSGNNTPQLDVRVDYTGNYDLGSSIPFVPIIPSPGFSAITNMSYIGNVGDKFVRRVTLSNFGKGPLQNLRFMRISGKDIKSAPQSGYNNKKSGDTLFTYFSAADFVKIGDKDSLLEQNESLVITDTFTITGCNYVNTYYEIAWGCNNKFCQFVKDNAAVTISSENPNMQAWSGYTDKFCYDGSTANAQYLSLTNIGKKPAKDVTVFIYVGTGAANTYIDTTSVKLKTNFKGTSKRKYLDTAYKLYYTADCVVPGATTYMRLKLGDLAPGDTFYLSWDMFRCALTTCNAVFYDLNWIYHYDYKNQCNTKTTVGAAWGKVYQYSGGGASLWVPTDLAKDETKDFKFTFNSFYNLQTGNNMAIRVDLVLPVTLEHSLSKSDFFITNGTLTQTWSPDSVVRRGDTLRAFFGKGFKFNLTNAEMTVRLKGVCSKYSGNTALPVTMSLYYNPQMSCNPNLWIRPVCVSFSTKVHCSKSCNGGMWFKNFDVERINFGLPDNDNDGIADGSGKLDMTKVRKERVMVGDTFLATFTGRPRSTSSINNWRYGYAESFVTYGNYIDVVEARLVSYKGTSLQTGNCNTVRVKKITSGINATFKFDFTVDSIYPKGCLSSSYRFTQNDSIMLLVKYKVTGNVGGGTALLNFRNRFYFGSVANPGSGQYFQCDTFGGNLVLYGYYYANCCADNVVYSNCAEVALSQSWYLGMGPCCVNYAGNNLFQYEFRPWTKMKALRVHLPSGFKLMNTYFGQYRTTGVGSYTLESTTGIPAKKGSTNPVVFEFGKYYKDSGGNIYTSDDGVQGYFTYTVQPKCDLPANTPVRIDYDYIFERQGSFGKGYDTISTKVSGGYDLFTYNPPALKLQPAVPVVYATSDTVEWEVRYSNPSAGFNAYNIWLSPKASSNIKVVEIRDADKDTIIKPVKDIYRAGILPAAQIRRFKIRAVYNDCNPDSLIIYGSYNCAEYPADFASYPCTPNSVALQLEPQNTRLQLTLTDSASTLDLCATNKLSLLVENIQSVAAYNTKIRIALPIGMQVVSGSAQLRYPVGASPVSLGLPKLVSGTIYEWDLAAASNAVAKGFKGTTDTTKNKLAITFRVITNCDYASGSFVSARAVANIKCGNPIPAIPAFSNPLDIKGVTRPYYTLVKSWADSLLPCEKPMTIKTRVIYLGPGKSGTKDLVEIFIPDGVKRDNSYWKSIRNAPHKDSFTVTNINGADLVSWKMPANIMPGDSMEFDIQVEGNSASLSCGPLDLITRCVVVQPVVCVSTGNSCDIKVITGSELATPLVNKGGLQIESAAISTKIITADSEQVALQFILRNKGAVMGNGSPLVLRYHFDANGSGKWDKNDPLIASDTMFKSLKTDSFFAVNRTLKLKAGQSCAVLVVVDSAACSCVFGQKLLPAPPLRNAGKDTSICSGNPLLTGAPKVNGFQYTWNNDQVVNDVNIAQPGVIIKNQTGAAEKYTLILTTNRGSCLSKDTVVIGIYPVPRVNIVTNDTAICEKQKVNLFATAFGGNGNNKFSWKPATGLKDTNLTGTEARPSAQTRYFFFVKDAQGCTSYDSVNILVNPYPKAWFTWPVSCQGSDVLVTDSTSISKGSVSLRIWKTALYDTFGVTQLPLSFGGAQQMAVTLIAESNEGCADTTVRMVDLKPLPVPQFTATYRCLGDSTVFVNTSSIASGNIQKWHWKFGDGNISSQQNPKHLYANYGNEVVWLYATSNFGCMDSTSGTAMVYPRPKAAFAYAKACEKDSLRFTNNTNLYGDTALTYSWNFGALGNSNLKNPSVSVPNFGSYDIQLKVQTIHGCRDSTTQSAVVFALPKAGFGTIDHCLKLSAKFSDSSKVLGGVTVQKFAWKFGDGGTSALQNPTYLYAKPGLFVATLKVETNEGCADSVSRNVEVFPLAKPTFFGSSHCFKENFTANSSYYGGGTPTSWKWYLGNTDSLSTTSISYTYNSPGTYLVKLRLITDKGCVSDSQANITVYPLPVVTATAVNPCNDDSISIAGNANISVGSVSQYQWTLSNGLKVNGKNVNRKLAPSGNYSGTLVATSDRFCVDSAQVNFVIGNPVKVDFSAADVCVDEESIFMNNSTSDEPVSRYIWNMGDGKSPSAKDPLYTYKTPGTYNVTLNIETKSGCLYGISKAHTVHPKPYPAFTLSSSVGSILDPDISVFDASSGATWLSYYTSDGLKTNQKNFTHAFPDSGSYRIWQVARNDYNCMDSVYKDVYINFMYSLFVPTAFSPNADGKNELFAPSGMGIEWYSMKVYTRWGELVYTTDNSKPWDGRINGELAPHGVYAVLLNVRDYKGRRHYYHGSVTLLR